MTQTIGFTLLILITLSSSLQDKQSARVCRLETKYNRLDDMTVVQCDNLIKWGEAPAGLTIKANASFRGKDLRETATFWLLLSSNRGVKTRQPQPLFREAKSLYLFLDSERLEIPVKEYRNSFYELIRSFEESAIAEIGPEDLRKLLIAKSLKGEWGSVQFKFSENAHVSLKDFILRQVFAESRR